MSIKITYEKTEKKNPMFKDIAKGSPFILGGLLYIKVDKVFRVREIENEIDCVHDLNHSENIQSQVYNALSITTHSYIYVSDDTEVKEVDIECIVREKK